MLLFPTEFKEYFYPLLGGNGYLSNGLQRFAVFYSNSQFSILMGLAITIRGCARKVIELLSLVLFK